MSRKVLARWIEDNRLSRELYFKTFRDYVIDTLQKRETLLKVGLENHRRFQYKWVLKRMGEHVKHMKWMRRMTKRALKFYHARLKRKSIAGWRHVSKKEKAWRLERERKMKELMAGADSKNLAEIFHRVKTFKKCFIAWEQFLQMCHADRKRAEAHYRKILIRRMGTCHRHWVKYYRRRKLKHRARTMGLRSIVNRYFTRLRTYATRRIAKRVRLEKMRTWHRKRFNGRVMKHWRSWQQVRAKVKARAAAFVHRMLSSHFLGWKKVTADERERERRLQAQAHEFWKSRRATLAIGNMYQNRLRTNTLRSMNVAALQHSHTALLRMVLNRWRARVDQIFFFRKTAGIAPILQSFWRWRLAKVRVALQRHMKAYCVGEIIKRRKQLVEVKDIETLQKLMKKYEWVVLLLWVPWAHGEHDGTIQVVHDVCMKVYFSMFTLVHFASRHSQGVYCQSNIHSFNRTFSHSSDSSSSPSRTHPATQYSDVAGIC